MRKNKGGYGLGNFQKNMKYLNLFQAIFLKIDLLRFGKPSL